MYIGRVPLSVVIILGNVERFIPLFILGMVNVKKFHKCVTDKLYLSIFLGVEGG
jgi:hypothetical protein